MEHSTLSEANSSTASQEIPRILCNQTVHRRLDVFTVLFVESYCIYPTNAQYMLTIICFLQSSYMFRCLYVILREFLITYAKVTQLINWKYL